MKHKYNIMGVNMQGKPVGAIVIAEDIIDAINFCRSHRINPHSIAQAEQVHSDTVLGFVPQL